MTFTDKYIQALKPKEKQYYVREGQGFAIRVLPSGVKTFVFIYTIRGIRKQMNLGVYPHRSLADARQRYREAATLVHAGTDPQASTPAALLTEPTVADLVKAYINHCKLHLVEKSVKAQERTLTKDLLATHRHCLLSNIRRRDAIAIIEGVASRAPGQARNLMKTARAMFSFAMHREMVELNPFTGITAAVPSIAPAARDRVLTTEELILIWRILNDPASYGLESVKRALLLTLITAQRPGEVAGMHRDEIDGNWWTIPKERTKYKTHPYRVYLSDLALRVIGKNTGYICPAPRTGTAITENSLPSLVNVRVDAAEKIPYFGFPRWTPHDLRRTAATKMSEELGALDEEIDAVLNHAKSGIIGVYNRSKYDKPKQRILASWSEWLENQLVAT